ncbi:hypothetical protein Pelo_17598 [Pelomyxa schiedti]|nr:hypothetical protein Pelo_17598 [Pelomyxa schiedti]
MAAIAATVALAAGAYAAWNHVSNIPFQYVRDLTEEEKEKIKHKYNITYYKYTVIKPLTQEVGGKTVTVPVGFLTDGCSGPLTCDKFEEAEWLMHDWLYSTHEVDKATADKVLASLPDRELAVHYFGDSAWETSGSRGPQFLP